MEKEKYGTYFCSKKSKGIETYQNFVSEIQEELSKYISFLEKEYHVCDLPKTIVWTDVDTATRLISDIPVPAYTNEFRVIMTPDLTAWCSIYLRQLDNLEKDESYWVLHDYYSNHLNRNNVLQILGHELAHHSALFLDDFSTSSSNGIWFEEGMAEYISRKYFLTDLEYQRECCYNQVLVGLLNKKYGGQSLERFGASTYEGDYAGIFFEYWRSFLTVHKIVEDFGGDVLSVFESYHRWNDSKSEMTLLDWFGVNL